MEIKKEGVKAGCKEFAKCLEILHLILDNEASQEQQKYLNDHILGCISCFEQYEVEKQIRVLIQTRLKDQKVPADLASEIRSKVFN